ncbi:hypothetical protein VFPFJ_06701 [Purpureocillium lilacinum]|uniref:Uncharacterized protein n=1 Tax=Purpureocillium lilacinum TaxID=33203 RepID=A0A179HCZ1_PURLI|nr:hypothetical protein VFPFJ_06701 [Purpureocillium lilacinum]OAQ80358.1 hypothetical protein VFPBJ_05943 [Purpureocillium lilacinum]OAQ88236.1 hypothetical protein VFPFJ_06701 [Purpureocillium lilacinum]
MCPTVSTCSSSASLWTDAELLDAFDRHHCSMAPPAYLAAECRLDTFRFRTSRTHLLKIRHVASRMDPGRPARSAVILSCSPQLSKPFPSSMDAQPEVA